MEQFRYVFVIHKLHEFEFTVGSFGVCYILKGPAQLFDGNVLTSDRVVGGTVDQTKRIVQYKSQRITMKLYYQTIPWAPDPIGFRFWYLLRMVNLVSPTSTV